ncbi:hypothetical protein B0F90DRAFT_1767245 [Multifurca ochricompacta]|uniref:Uncharacterized protein n=1 Tax=Multifurca ochricompacta TaxID=376703 RepID=A0AAD4LY16_9AGAM|nr:hypothetical protein B0F90DRAFT_1767245 [Multifurca ochricompacta]
MAVCVLQNLISQDYISHGLSALCPQSFWSPTFFHCSSRCMGLPKAMGTTISSWFSTLTPYRDKDEKTIFEALSFPLYGQAVTTEVRSCRNHNFL